jgi:hypothetical protein
MSNRGSSASRARARLRTGAVIVAAGVLLAATPTRVAPAAPTAAANTPSVGVNLSGLSYWGAEWMFVDLVKRIKDWGGKVGKSYRVDENGWITWLAPSTRGIAQLGDGDKGFERNFPLGRYVALYKGKGHLSVSCVRCSEISRAPGRVVVDILESNFVWIIVDAVDAHDHMRDIAVVPIEHEKTYLTQPFHPKFLEHLRSFAAIREIGNQKTNGSLQVHWSDRPSPTQAFQDTDNGVALEYMVDLANQSGADPWFCMPVRADDDYIQNFARSVWKRLDSKRTVYVEYGNELWNDGYPFGVDGIWVGKKGRERNIPLPAGDDGSDMTYRLRYQVYRSREIFEIFQHEMDALKIDRNRLVRVIASQASYYDRIRQTLDYRFPDGTLGYQHADALAVAPYFAGLWDPEDSEQAENKWSVDEMLDYAACSIAGPGAGHFAHCPKSKDESMATIMRRDHEMAQARGLRLLGYEGGQHIMAWNGHPAFVAKLAAVNRSPRMKDIYERYLESWKDNGGDLLCLVNYVQVYGRFGYWGLLERQDQKVAEAPKLAGTLEFMDRHPRWWPMPITRPTGSDLPGAH